MPPLLVEPAISRAKFDREIATYRDLENDYIRRGWWLVKAEFPEVFVVFGNSRLRPSSVMFGVIINFTNYDLWPPSVRIVDPFTQIPYTKLEIPVKLFRKVAVVDPQPDQPQWQLVPDLLQAHALEDIPFICLPGIREYHEHPAHSGNSWFLHRASGAGSLYFILDVLYRYGVKPIAAYKYQIQLQFGLDEESISE
jgi:hypothetical protein